MKTIGLVKNSFRALFFVLVLVLLSLSSCEINFGPDYGYNGRDGDAYLALEYDDYEPAYLEVPAFPERFTWGRYYYIEPGLYQMYYEIDYYRWGKEETAAWEVDYEIWVYEGERGGHGYDGMDAPDTYFTLYCNINGADLYEDDGWKSTEKRSNLPESYKLQESTANKKVYKVENENFGMKITYTKVEPKQRK
jgi:hypothetical protein